MLILFLLGLIAIPTIFCVPAPPATPAWPQKFTINFDVRVKQYGDNWFSNGTLYYDYNIKTFRSDYINWCLPLFDSGAPENNNYTCSFLATAEDMFFVNFTSAGKWEDYDCCLFQKGLPAIPPDWMKNGQYNGTDVIDDITVDVWWFPGTNNASKNPCYGYWSAKDDINTPVRFFGLTSVGPTILNYHDFEPNKIPQNIEMKPPNENCYKKCEPPVAKLLKKPVGNAKWSEINWPSCE